MRFIHCLPILFCLPALSVADNSNNTTNSLPEQQREIGITAPGVAETNNIAALTQTNVSEAVKIEDTSTLIAENSGPEAAARPADDKEPVSVPPLTYFVHQDDTGSRGSTFLLEDTNGVWLVSNCHVFSGSTNLTILNIEGKTLEVPRRIEVAKDRDIIRFRTEQPKGLSLSSSCEFEESLSAYGDSGGAGVLTKLEGKALAIGPDRIEISASIIPGNSGGPVVNANNEVLGVSSYLLRHSDLPDWIADGTGFTDTRRMALRLNDIEWVPVDFSEFYRETLALDALEESLYEVIFITAVLSDGRYTTIISTTDNREIQSWLKKHNRYVKKGTTSSRRAALRNIQHLARLLQHMEESPTADCEITIPYLQGKLDDIKEACAATRKQLEALSN